MILIQKGKAPNSLVQYKYQFDASFNNLPSVVKNDIRTALLEEQGFLCAYCMKAINDKSMKIEHYQARTPDNELDYKNLLACCSGGEQFGDYSERTCDTYKEDKVLHIDPQNINHITTIRYRSSDGTILSSLEFGNELSDILNLNSVLLKTARKNIIDALDNTIGKKFGSKPCSKSYLQALLNKYSSRVNNHNTSFLGVYVWYLTKKIRQCRA